MLRVTIELVPFGWGKPVKLGSVDIANDASGTSAVGNYRATLYDKGDREYRRVEVKNFPRKKLLAFDLLYRVLQQAVGDRNV